jgi:hypothetical protein
MIEIGRIVDGVLQPPERMTARPRELHVHHHYHPNAPVEHDRPVQHGRPMRSVCDASERRPIVDQKHRRDIAPVDPVGQISETLAAVVRAARELSDHDRRRIYDVLHGSVSLVAALISLDRTLDKNRFESALRRDATK